MKIIGGVSAAILVIELILLIPSLVSRRRQLRDIRMMTAKVLAQGLYQPVAESVAEGNRARALRIVEAAARNEYVSMVTLVDANRIVLACSVELHVGAPHSTPAIEAVLGPGAPAMASAEQRGRYFYVLPIPGPGGGAVAALEVAVDLSDIPAELLALVLRTLGFVVIILVFTGAVIGLYLYAIVLRPVWRIVRANLAAAEGDRANAYVPAAEIPGDEIGDIARTRNEMLAVIEQHSQDLEAVILRGISDPIALLDAGRRVLLRNRPAGPPAGEALRKGGPRESGQPAAASVDGATQDGGCGCEVHRLLPDLPGDACPVARALETGRPAWLAFAAGGPEGTRYLEAFTFPLTEDGARGGAGAGAPGGPGRARKVVEQVRDVTERRRLEEAARRNERLAVVGELAAAMAHEIRNPLASIVASADLLDFEPGRPVDQEAQVLLGVLKKESRRIDRLLADFLRFARPRPLRIARTDVNAICRGIAELVRTHPKNNGRVTIREALDTALEPIEADADLLEQALLNIAINAVEAMPEGGELSIATAAGPTTALAGVGPAGLVSAGGGAAPGDDLSPGGNLTRGGVTSGGGGVPGGFASGGGVEIAIADTGAGMSEAERERIFEPFHTTKKDGTGLGLAITYRIVESHGGSIAVDSRPGAGTTVRIRLPRKARPSPGPSPRSGRFAREAPLRGAGEAPVRGAHQAEPHGAAAGEGLGRTGLEGGRPEEGRPEHGGADSGSPHGSGSARAVSAPPAGDRRDRGGRAGTPSGAGRIDGCEPST